VIIVIKNTVSIPLNLWGAAFGAARDVFRREKKMLKKLLITVLILVAPVFSWSHEDLKNQLQGYELPARPREGYGMVYIVRPSEVGLFIEFHVYLDAKLGKNRVGRTKGREYLFFEVSPGKHRIISQGNNTKYKDIDIKPGEILFIQQVVKIDVDRTDQDNMKILSEEEGKHYLKTTTLGIYDRH
jgi:hypothetical protein